MHVDFGFGHQVKTDFVVGWICTILSRNLFEDGFMFLVQPIANFTQIINQGILLPKQVLGSASLIQSRLHDLKVYDI